MRSSLSAVERLPPTTRVEGGGGGRRGQLPHIARGRQRPPEALERRGSTSFRGQPSSRTAPEDPAAAPPSGPSLRGRVRAKKHLDALAATSGRRWRTTPGTRHGGNVQRWRRDRWRGTTPRPRPTPPAGGAAVPGHRHGLPRPDQHLGGARVHGQQGAARRIQSVRLGRADQGAGAVVLLLGVHGDAGAREHDGAALRAAPLPARLAGRLLRPGHTHALGRPPRGRGAAHHHQGPAGPAVRAGVPVLPQHAGPVDAAAGAAPLHGHGVRRHVPGDGGLHGRRRHAVQLAAGLALRLLRARRPGAAVVRPVVLPVRGHAEAVQGHLPRGARLHRGQPGRQLHRLQGHVAGALEVDPDVGAGTVAARGALRPELRPLDAAHRDAQLHEERAALQHQGGRTVLGAALHLPVAGHLRGRLDGAEDQRAPLRAPRRVQEDIQLYGALGVGVDAADAGAGQAGPVRRRGHAHRGRHPRVVHLRRLLRQPHGPVAQLRRRPHGHVQRLRQRHGHPGPAHRRQHPQGQVARGGRHHLVVRVHDDGGHLLRRQPGVRAAVQGRGAALERPAEPREGRNQRTAPTTRFRGRARRR